MNTRTRLFAFLCAAASAAVAAPNGPYLSYVGNDVGKNGRAEMSNFIGAESGAGIGDTTRSGFYGVRSGAYSRYLYGVNALGFWSSAQTVLLTNVFAVGTSSAREAHDVEDSVFVGVNAGRNAYFVEDSVFFGSDTGRNAYFVKDGVFFGAGAGRDVHGVTGRVDVCGLVYADRASGDFRIGSPATGLSYSDGRLRIGGRTIAEKPTTVPFAFDLCLSPDGDDAADGLTLGTAKRTLAGVVAAANATGRTNLVVAAFEGDYEPPYADFGADNAISFRAVGDRARTRVVGGTNAVCALESASCAWRGFTFTGFKGKGAEDDGNSICRFGGMTFRDCDFVDNEYYVESGYSALNSCVLSDCTMRDCTFNVNTYAAISRGSVMYGCVFSKSRIEFGMNGVGPNGERDNSCYPFFPLERVSASDTLFRADRMNFTASTRCYLTNCTFLVKRVTDPSDARFIWKATQIPTKTPPVNCFFVIDGLLGPDEVLSHEYGGITGTVSGVPTRVDGSYVAVPSANLTEDGVAADADCPAVRDDGQPDYGWKSSGLGAVKTALAQAKKLSLMTPTVTLTAEEEARGVTYVKNGLNQDCAIAIGTNAVASVDPAYVARAPSNAVLRSVSVAIGGNADARGDGTGTSQGVAIGWWAQAKAGNAVAIGSGAQHTNETAMGGNATVANAACAVALGYSAKATAPSAVQIGFGTNATPHSLQFEGVQIVRDGRLVAPGIETADVRRVVGEMLAPRTYEDLSGDVIEVRSRTLTVIAPTNGPCDEIELAPTLTRNYEVFLSNTPAMRESLPLSFDTESGDVAKLGAWWGRKLVRLPAKVSVKSPSEDIAILEVETYDDGWDWTPLVTNATFAVTGGTVRLERVLGVNLHGVTEVRVAYEGTDGKTNEVVSTAVRNPLYGKVEPEIAAIPQGGFADGAGVTVTASGETGTCAFAADPFAKEEGGQ